MFGYHVPAPDEAMLISGGKSAKNSADTPFRVVTGHGAFVIPFFRKVRFLTLSMAEAEVEERCVTKQGITLNVRAVIAFKVGNDSESIVNAGQRFLSDQNQMSVMKDANEYTWDRRRSSAQTSFFRRAMCGKLSGARMLDTCA